MGLSRTVSERNGHFALKSQTFSTPWIYRPPDPQWWVSLELCNGGGFKKLRTVEKLHYHLISLRDGQTNGRAERNRKKFALCILCMLTRDKNQYWSSSFSSRKKNNRTKARLSVLQTVCGNANFIARQQAMHAERDIVMANPSVRPTPCLNV